MKTIGHTQRPWGRAVVGIVGVCVGLTYLMRHAEPTGLDILFGLGFLVIGGVVLVHIALDGPTPPRG